ncbi:hypothetical protein [Azovibrio restrictus]|uniref:hypothetical protein n=1 Tax=Azovibrio restrictus TaxID=146938 RepID=UPI0026EB5495|nr:hypothetical protein [Azovibrio restrictus]MDD3481753.1 hypothetical protein [Azovibrio restrictus]
MARYKWIDTSPRFLAVDLAKQLLPGSFDHLFEHEIDLGDSFLPTVRLHKILHTLCTMRKRALRNALSHSVRRTK